MINHDSFKLMSFTEGYIPADLFYTDSIDYFDLQRVGGLKTYLYNEHKGKFYASLSPKRTQVTKHTQHRSSKDPHDSHTNTSLT